VRGCANKVTTIEENFAALGTVKTVDAVERAGLASAVRSNERENFTGVNVETHTGKRGKTAKGEAQVLGSEQGGAGRRRIRQCRLTSLSSHVQIHCRVAAL